MPLLLALLLLVVAPARIDARRGKHIPEPLRFEVERITNEVHALRLARHDARRAPSWGEVAQALAALQGLIPYPHEEAERRLMEDALRCLEKRAPDVARTLSARMQTHYLNAARGGAEHG